jgi:hypothetical protein
VSLHHAIRRPPDQLERHTLREKDAVQVGGHCPTRTARETAHTTQHTAMQTLRGRIEPRWPHSPGHIKRPQSIREFIIPPPQEHRIPSTRTPDEPIDSPAHGRHGKTQQRKHRGAKMLRVGELPREWKSKGQRSVCHWPLWMWRVADSRCGFTAGLCSSSS